MYDFAPPGLPHRSLAWVPARTLGRLSAAHRLGIAAALLAAVCGLVGYLVDQSYVDVERTSITAAGNIVAAVAQNEARDIEMLDLSLRSVQDTYLDPEVMASDPRLIRLVVFDRASTARDIDAVLVIDAHGRIVLDSRFAAPRVANFGRSDFFVVHKERADAGLFIGHPFRSPFDGEWSIALSRRLARSDGAFAGVVAGIIKLSYFRRLFEPLQVGDRGRISLVGFDGTVMMVHPYSDAQIGRVLNIDAFTAHVRRVPQGSFQAVSNLDGLRRLYFYRQVGGFPLVQTVGFATDDLFRPWQENALMVGAAMVIFCGAIMALVGYLNRELGRRVQAEAAYEQLAATDKLTGLPNRRKFDEVLALEVERSRRSSLPLSLLMIDVDHFKAYNDQYGHLGGDAILAMIGQSLQASLIRSADLAVRFGGEEFALILPDTEVETAGVVAERVRERIESLMQPHRGSPIRFLTVSIGAATLRPGGPESARDLIAAADAALYEAKTAGRDRVVLARREPCRAAA